MLKMIVTENSLLIDSLFLIIQKAEKGSLSYGSGFLMLKIRGNLKILRIYDE